VFHVLSIRPCLVENGVDPDFFPKECFRATLGVVLYAIAVSLAGYLLRRQWRSNLHETENDRRVMSLPALEPRGGPPPRRIATRFIRKGDIHLGSDGDEQGHNSHLALADMLHQHDGDTGLALMRQLARVTSP